MVGVEQWAVVRRMHRVDGLSGREISRRPGLHGDTNGPRACVARPNRSVYTEATSPIIGLLISVLLRKSDNGRRIRPRVLDLRGSRSPGVRTPRGRLWAVPSSGWGARTSPDPECYRVRLMSADGLVDRRRCEEAGAGQDEIGGEVPSSRFGRSVKGCTPWPPS